MAGIVAVYLMFTVATIVTKRPWVDEAWFTSPGLDLVTRGKFATLLLDPAGSHLRLFKPDAELKGIDQHTYWVMPLYLLQGAVWGRVFGFSLFSIRTTSLLWGLVALASVGVVIRRLYPAGGYTAAAIGMGVLAVDFGFVDSASDGRMDMMCSALGFASLAAYVWLRERSVTRAAVVSHALAAAACFTHPNGVFASAALVMAMVWLDRKQVRPATVAAMLAPYAIGAVAWGIYGAQAPADFVAQFKANSAGKADRMFEPWKGIWLEIHDRWGMHYWPPGMSGKLKAIGLVLLLGAMVILARNRGLRESSGCRLMFWLVVLRFLLLGASGGPKFDFYMIHILPYFAAAIGMAAGYLWWAGDRRVRLTCGAALLAYFGVQTAAVAHKVALRGYQREYLPVVQYLESAIRPGDLVAVSSEFGFKLGFYNPQLVDDVWLGYWSSKKPTVVVVDQWYYEPVMNGAAQKGIPAPGYFPAVLSSFDLIREFQGYRVYRRRT
jgi:hypothetical protein